MKNSRLTALIGLLTVLAGCSATEECGPFPDKFRTTGFLTEVHKVGPGVAPGEQPTLLDLNGDTLSEGELGIRMIPIQETYFSHATMRVQFALVPSAYACSPHLRASDEIIRRIEIVSDRDFDGAHPAGSDLADLFTVVVLDQARGVFYRKFDLSQFLAENPNAVDELILVLEVGPESTAAFDFQVTFQQEGDGLTSYEYLVQGVLLSRT